MSNPKAPADPVETPSIDARLVRKLADILKDTGLSAKSRSSMPA
jgi:acetyl-CoA carboxylase biotin carboxyl carrier protein